MEKKKTEFMYSVIMPIALEFREISNLFSTAQLQIVCSNWVKGSEPKGDKKSGSTLFFFMKWCQALEKVEYYIETDILLSKHLPFFKSTCLWGHRNARRIGSWQLQSIMRPEMEIQFVNFISIDCTFFKVMFLKSAPSTYSKVYVLKKFIASFMKTDLQLYFVCIM